MVASLASSGSNLFALTNDVVTGCEVWSYEGNAWTKASPDGFGDKNNWSHAMTTDGTNLYVGTYSVNYSRGTQIWKYGGGAWSQINADGFGDAKNHDVSISTCQGDIYAGTGNPSTGCEVWKYSVGAWSQINADGFGKIQNGSAFLGVYNNGLYAGTGNADTGCEIWKTQLPEPLALASIKPSSGMAEATVNITNLAGTGFIDEATVRLELAGAPTINATEVVVVSSKQITCKLSLAGSQVGAYAVIVRNPKGQEAKLAGGFTVTAWNPCGGGAAASVALCSLMFGLLSLAGSKTMRRYLRKSRG
jgi:hypothetical protein